MTKKYTFSSPVSRWQNDSEYVSLIFLCLEEYEDQAIGFIAQKTWFSDSKSNKSYKSYVERNNCRLIRSWMPSMFTESHVWQLKAVCCNRKQESRLLQQKPCVATESHGGGDRKPWVALESSHVWQKKACVAIESRV